MVKDDQLKYDLAEAILMQTMKVYDLRAEVKQLKSKLDKVEQVLDAGITYDECYFRLREVMYG